MDPVPEVSGSTPPPSPETPVVSERDRVIGALNETLTLMSTARDNGELSEEQGLQLTDVLFAKSKTLDVGKEYFSHQPVVSEATGKTYRYQERIPVEGMLDFLHTKLVAEASKPGHERNVDLITQYHNLERTLMGSSRPFKNADKDIASLKDGERDRLIERIRLEARLYSLSDRDTGDTVQNWLNAERAIQNRLHLYIPKESAVTELPVRTEPPTDEPPSEARPPIEPTPPEEPSTETPPAPEPPEASPTPPTEGSGGETSGEDGSERDDEERPDDTSESEDDGETPKEDFEDETIIKIGDQYVMVLGNHHAAAEKKTQDDVSREMQKYEEIPITATNSLRRAWQTLRYRLTKDGLTQGMKYFFTRELIRYKEGEKKIATLAGLNRRAVGATQTPEAVARLNELINEEKELVKRAGEHIKAGGSGLQTEQVSEAIEGQFKQDIINKVLQPAREQLKGGMSDEKVRALVQETLFKYVISHQDESNPTHAMIREYFGKNQQRYGSVSEFYASNMVELAKAINADERVSTLTGENLANAIQVRLLRAQQGKSSEVTYTATDRLMRATQKGRPLSWLNPTTVGIAAAVTTLGSRKAVRYAAGAGAVALVANPLTAPIVGLAAAGVFAGRREWQRYKSDIKDVARDLEGSNVSRSDGVFRSKVERLVSPLMIRSDQLINGDTDTTSMDRETGQPRKSVEDLLKGPLTSSDVHELPTIIRNRQAVASRIAEIQARLDSPYLPKRRFFRPVLADIGRIQYSSDQTVEASRTLLVTEMYRLQNALQESAKDDADRDDIQQTLSSMRERWSNHLLDDRETQEWKYRFASVKRSMGQGAKAAVIGGTLGGVLGLLNQEVLAAGARITPDSISAPGIHIGEGQTQLESALGINEDANTKTEVNSHTTETMRYWRPLNESSEAFSYKESLEVAGETGHGDLFLNEQYHLSYDADTGSSIINTQTNEILFSSNDVVINPDGQVQITGELPSNVEKIFTDLNFNVDSIDAVNSPVEYTVFGPDVKMVEVAMGTGPDAPHTLVPEGTVWVDGTDGAHTLLVADRPDIVLVADAKFVDGEFTWNKEYSYPGYDSRIGERTEGLFSQVQISSGEAPPTSTVETKAVLGEHGELESAKRDAHWTWETTGREPYATHEELGMKTDMAPGVGGKYGDAMLIRMDSMTTTDIPGRDPVVVSQIVQEGRAGAALSFHNAAGEEFSILVPDSADGTTDGIITLDPNDNNPDHYITRSDGSRLQLGELARMAINQDKLQELKSSGAVSYGDIGTELNGHQDVWTPFAISAAELTENPDGSYNVRSFATIHGSDTLPSTVEVPTTVPGEKIPTITFNAPLTEKLPVTTITPPETPVTEPMSGPERVTTYSLETKTEEPPPIIPIAFAPRETLERAMIIYGYGTHEGLGWVPEDEYETRKSPRLRENPYARLDEDTEVRDYLSSRDSGYRVELEEMDRKINEPMSARTRAVITVPAFGEGKIIRKTLEQFLNQTDTSGNPINPELFEIIVFENDTEDRPRDETEREIQRFKNNHPNMRVHYAYKRWTADDINNGVNTVGNGRRYNCDLALLRGSKRSNKDGELIVINNDADLEGITPTYIYNVVQTFDNNEEIDTVVGKRNIPDWALRKPNVRAGQRLWEVFDSVMRHTGGHDKARDTGTGMEPSERKRGWPGMIGENSAMRASIYAAVGGYGPNAKLAEDQNLGDMIRKARNYDDKRFIYANKLQTIKNPRRYLTSILQNQPMISMYDDYHENKDLRTMNNDDLLSRIPDSFDRNRFQLDADGVYQKMHDYPHLVGGNFEVRFKKVMDLMGVQYIIENGHVRITDSTRLEQGLARYNTPASPTSRFRRLFRRN